METPFARNIVKYQAAFRQPNMPGLWQPIVIGNLNRWFIEAEITRNGREISIIHPTKFFDNDGYSVTQELTAALLRAMNASGVIPASEEYSISIIPARREIHYTLDNERNAGKFTEFLQALKELVRREDEIRKSGRQLSTLYK